MNLIMRSRILIAAFFVLMFSVSSFAQIANTAHDFSGNSWNLSQEICVVCHTPHNANTSITDAPLWSHNSTVATFTPYASSTLNAVVGQPDGSSKMCLSCHDGSIKIDSYNTTGIAYPAGTQTISNFNKIGSNLNTEHPISFTYDAALATADGGLYDPTSVPAIAGMLSGGKMQCSSCHDVHNGPGTVSPGLLVKSNAGSALCLTCHNK